MIIDGDLMMITMMTIAMIMVRHDDHDHDRLMILIAIMIIMTRIILESPKLNWKN